MSSLDANKVWVQVFPKRIRRAIQRHKIQMCPATDQRSPYLREFPKEFGQKIDTLNVGCDVLFVQLYGQF